MHKVTRWVKNIHWFDAAIVATVVVVLVSFFLFFYRRAEYITIKVKVTDQEVLTAFNEPRNYYAWQFHVGDVERDVIGRVITEITDVESFSIDPERQAVYLTLRVRATYDTRTRTYSARGKTLMYGTPMRFNLNNVTFDGFVIDAPNLIKLNVEEQVVKVTAIARNIEPAVLRAVKVGDTMSDNQGKVLVKVNKLESFRSEQVTTDFRGNFAVRNNPLSYDLRLELDLLVKKVNGREVVMFDNYRVNIGNLVPITTSRYSLYPMIEKIEGW